MKTTKIFVTGILAVVSLALACITSHAQDVTVAYNFDTGIGAWSTGPDGDLVTNVWDPTEDSSNNPASGSMKVEVNYHGSSYVLSDVSGPWYSPLPLQGPMVVTNLQFDVKYYSAAPGLVRTNVSPWDFGEVLVGSRDVMFAQDWYGSFAVPATNGLGQPNTNWVHIQVDLSQVPTQYPFLAISGLIDTMFAQGDASLSGTQFIWFDNIIYDGWAAPLKRPVIVSVQKTGSTVVLVSTNVVATHAYQLQYTTSLNPTSWINADSSQAAGSTTVTNTDTAATATNRFYRVMEQ